MDERFRAGLADTVERALRVYNFLTALRVSNHLELGDLDQITHDAANVLATIKSLRRLDLKVGSH